MNEWNSISAPSPTCRLLPGIRSRPGPDSGVNESCGSPLRVLLELGSRSMGEQNPFWRELKMWSFHGVPLNPRIWAGMIDLVIRSSLERSGLVWWPWRVFWASDAHDFGGYLIISRAFKIFRPFCLRSSAEP